MGKPTLQCYACDFNQKHITSFYELGEIKQGVTVIIHKNSRIIPGISHLLPGVFIKRNVKVP